MDPTLIRPTPVHPVRPARPPFWRAFPVSTGLGALVLAFYLGELALGGPGRPETLIRLGAVRGDLVREQGEWWRLLCAPFLHGGLGHLLMNGLAFVQLAPLVELVYGRWRLLAVYLLSALGGTLASSVSLPLASVGASGAILGLAGLLLGTSWLGRDPWRADLRRLLGRSLLYGVLLTFAVGIGLHLLWFPIIDNPGHLGGLLSGFAASLAFRSPERREGPGVTLLAGLLAGLLLAAIGGMLRDGGRAAPRAQDDHQALLLAEARRNPAGSLARTALPELAPYLMEVERDADAEWATNAWLVLAPDDPQAQNARAWFLLTRPAEARRDPAEALKLAEQAVATLTARGAQPLELAPVLDTQAVALRRVGRAEEAGPLELRVIEALEAALTAGDVAGEGSSWAYDLLLETARRRADQALAGRTLLSWLAALPEDPRAHRALARALLEGTALPPDRGSAALALAEARQAEALTLRALGPRSELGRVEVARAQALQQQALRALTPDTAR